MRHNFKNLKIWQLSMEITYDVYEICMSFPRNETYCLADQMNRASISMASNIAEGSSRGDKHFRHYLSTSLGSSFELHTQLLIAKRRNYSNDEHLQLIENKITEFQKMTTGFIDKLELTPAS
jgi:four helix bundle protein